jgi:subtilisin
MIIKALTAEGAGDFGAVAQGITYAVNNGASIINMSLGGSSASQAVIDAVADAITHNVIVVAAAGNSGNSAPVSFPASIDSVIAVGATDQSDTLANFSCTGAALDLVAPGVDIVSTIPGGNTAPGNAGNSGTSFSAPIVAGAAALIRSIAPTMSVAKVTEYLTLTATDLGASGTDNAYGHGLLNAKLAVQSALAGSVLTAPAATGTTHLYPNPFNPLENANAHFALPASLGNSGIEIKIYNVAG